MKTYALAIVLLMAAPVIAQQPIAMPPAAALDAAELDYLAEIKAVEMKRRRDDYRARRASRRAYAVRAKRVISAGRTARINAQGAANRGAAIIGTAAAVDRAKGGLNHAAHEAAGHGHGHGHHYGHHHCGPHCHNCGHHHNAYGTWYRGKFYPGSY